MQLCRSSAGWAGGRLSEEEVLSFLENVVWKHGVFRQGACKPKKRICGVVSEESRIQRKILT